MLDNLLNVLNVVKIAETIEGRKRFQKMIFILKQLGADFDERFVYHYYGPYSQELQLELDYLIINGLIQEQVEGSSYVYKLTEKGLKKLNGSDEISSYKSVIDDLNSKSASFLEVLSTIFYLSDSGYSDQEVIRKKLSYLKPHLSSHFKGAFEYFNETNIV